MSRLFGHGDLRLYLLKLLDEEPRHGYEVIVSLEDRFLGLYRPSPGTVYPRLQALADEGLVEVEEVGGKKVYRLTEAGERELIERAEELKELGKRIASSARGMAKEIRDDVRASVKDLRREVKEAAREARRDERRQGRVRVSIRIGDAEGSLRGLQEDLDAFVRDVVEAARRHDLNADRLRGLRDVLRDARVRVIEVLETGEPGSDG